MSIVQLRQLVGNQIGLPATFDGTMAATNALEVPQKQALTAGMLDYIKNHPGDFTTQQVSVANNTFRAGDLTSTAGYQETDLITAFGEELKTVLGDPLASIGNGVKNTLNLTGTLLPWLAVIAMGIFALPYIKSALSKKV